MAPRILGRVSAARKSRQFVARINLVAIGAIADMARADSYQLIDLCQRERRLGPSGAGPSSREKAPRGAGARGAASRSQSQIKLTRFTRICARLHTPRPGGERVVYVQQRGPPRSSFERPLAYAGLSETHPRKST